MHWEAGTFPSFASGNVEARDAWMHNALQRVASRAVTPISGFDVGALLEMSDGRLYAGVNVELRSGALGDSIHAEQCAVAHAYVAQVSRVRLLSESDAAAFAVRPRGLRVNASPCGHCRQFLVEMADGADVQVEIGSMLPHDLSVARQPVRELLPRYFSPAHLGISTPLFANLGARTFEVTDLASERAVPLLQGAAAAGGEDDSSIGWEAMRTAALDALRFSYVPYSNAPSAVALWLAADEHGGAPAGVVAGMAIENAAYNPTMSPLHVAFVQAVVQQPRWDTAERAGKDDVLLRRVRACLLVEPHSPESLVRHEDNVRRILQVLGASRDRSLPPPEFRVLPLLSFCVKYVVK